MDPRLLAIVSQFDITGEPADFHPINTGHINSTYRVTVSNAGSIELYTLQKINKYVFKQPDLVMENICLVTDFLRGKVVSDGGDAERQVLRVIPCKNGIPYFIDEDGEYWRIYRYIDRARTYNTVENPIHLKNAGYAFGRFQTQLADFPIEKLHDTIPNFHNTPKRFADFFAGVEADACGRVKNALPEIEILKKFHPIASFLTDKQKEGILPLRVTHNDTKYNNILIDDATNNALCVIDLDTVMPGLAAYDFGDAIRFAANTAAEDETDLSKVSLDLGLYECFTSGFVSAISGFLGDEEIKLLPYGALLMTLEVGSRFLLDYLDGDKYFKIHRPEHNLERARTQLTLALDMERHFDEMNEIVRKYL
ncbi:MAG: aminoglycoside phosphotransferase family protein [Clostridia bacterium]|nr:aminoglycoside phosphotransferase family protein [Clostridia bacterium]